VPGEVQSGRRYLLMRLMAANRYFYPLAGASSVLGVIGVALVWQNYTESGLRFNVGVTLMTFAILVTLVAAFCRDKARNSQGE